MQFVVTIFVALLALLVPGGLLGAGAVYYVKSKRNRVVEDIQEEADYDPVFDRAPDDQGYSVNGTAWATWYAGDGLEDMHTSVWWKPALDSSTEPEYNVVNWDRKNGRKG